MTYQQQPPVKKRHTGLIVTIIVLLVLLACGIGGIALVASAAKDATGASQDATPIDTPAPSPGSSVDKGEPSAPPRKPAAAKAVVVREGTWSVPSEVGFGTYTTTVPDSTPVCSWATLKVDGDLDAVHNVGVLQPGARGRLTIGAGDHGVQFQGGCKWTKVK